MGERWGERWGRERARRDGRVAHLDDKEEDGRLRRAHHVLCGRLVTAARCEETPFTVSSRTVCPLRHELDDAAGQLRPLGDVAADT